MYDNSSIVRKQESVLATNRVLRNTYLLLSLTLLFSAAMAIVSVATNARSPGIIITLVGIYGLMFLTQALRNSIWGLVSAFAFTGFMGYLLGPILNLYIHNFSNGSELIATALGTTGAVFLGLSAYVLTTRKDFSYLGGFLMAAVIGAVVLSVLGLFFHAPILSLAISGLFVLISSGLILFETSMIIQGGVTNYIMATISLYVSIYNLFISLLQIFAAFAGNRNQ